MDKMVVAEKSIQELREMVSRRNDIPLTFAIAHKSTNPTACFHEHSDSYIHSNWETTRDNGSLYPSEDSFTPYLEMI